MKNTFIFIDNKHDIENLDNLQMPDAKIFSFNIQSHKFLEEKNIPHIIAENYISKEDHEKIFDSSIKLWNWYDANFFNDLKFKNVNLLSITDTSEFHQIIIRELYTFFVIKRILDTETPKKIFLSSHFAKMVKQIKNDKKIFLEISNNQTHDFHIQWEKMLIRFKIGKKPISIPISRKHYNFSKKIFELIIGNLLGLWCNFKDNSPAILFLEFNPSQYPSLLRNLEHFEGNLIFFNRRRSAIWNIPSIKLLRKSNAKLISSELSLTKKEKNLLNSELEHYNKIFDKIWDNNQIFSQIFSVEGCNFWPVVSEILFKTYKYRIQEYLELILISKKILDDLNIGCIISLNVLGETEKTILKINDNHIPSILLEHGATNYLPEFKKYDISNMYPLFKDKIALWGEIQKDYLLKHRSISEDKILVTGSPRHEDFFNSKIKKQSSEKILLITPQVLSEFNAFVDTNTYLRLEELLKKIFKITNKLSNVKVIVKMHPTLAPGNEFVKSLIYKLNPNVTIFQMESVIDVINSCDAILNINTEFFPSTVVYEGLILEKPIINILMIDEFYNFELVKDDAVISLSDNDDLESSINDILENHNLRNMLIQNGRKHLKRYFSNHLSASKELANILTSFSSKKF